MERFFVGSLFDGKAILHNIQLSVEKGKVVGLQPRSQPAPTDKVLEGLLSPGFIDLQVNGGGGVLFNQVPTVNSLRTIVQAHRQFGTTSMLPTLITDDLTTIQQAANSVSQLIAQPLSGIVGIHFEGPHLSLLKKGIHPAQFIRPISDNEFQQYTRTDLGKVKVTVAPENVSVDIIKDLVKQGVSVFLGHSNADIDTVMAAVEAGASGFTHLFNAMSAMSAREPGMLGCALAVNGTYCGLIVDLLHVHPINCQLAMSIKSAEKLLLVTDAMGHVGSEQDTHRYFDSEITRTGNKLTTPDGRLAGSNLDMASAVRNTHTVLNINLQDTLQMATITPATCIGLDANIGQIAPGYDADFVLLNDNLVTQSTWLKGQCVFSKSR